MATLVRSVRFLANSTIPWALRSTCLTVQRVPQCRKFSRFSALMTEKKFSEQHEWVTVEGNVGTVGISNFAQDALGEIVYAQLPDVGADFDREDEVGALESVKQASELYTPLSGKIVEANTQLEDKPGLINESCYDEGWLFKVEMKNKEELNDLMDESGYEKFLKENE